MSQQRRQSAQFRSFRHDSDFCTVQPDLARILSEVDERGTQYGTDSAADSNNAGSLTGQRIVFDEEAVSVRGHNRRHFSAGVHKKRNAAPNVNFRQRNKRFDKRPSVFETSLYHERYSMWIVFSGSRYRITRFSLSNPLSSHRRKRSSSDTFVRTSSSLCRATQ